MSEEDTVDHRTGGPPPPSSTDAATASQVAQRAPQLVAAKPMRVVVSPGDDDAAAAAGGSVPPPAYTGVLHLQQPVEQQTDKEKRTMWFNDMRGWLMVVAVQVASVTYQAGLDPPDATKHDGTPAPPVPESTSYFPERCDMFFYFNTTAFVTSLAIIILLMNRSFYHSEAKVVALEIIMVLDMVGLMGAYWAGSTRRDDDQTNNARFTVGLTALVLFAIYVVYMVQLMPKLWRLVVAVVPPRRRVAAAVRVHDDDHAAPADGKLSVRPNRVDEGRSSSQQRLQDGAGHPISAPRWPTPRHRGIRSPGVLGIEPSRMLSP